MPRPRKFRRICCSPEARIFGPLGQRAMQNEPLIMTLDELETLRLIDVEHKTQEECAESMNVARATVQKIYEDARHKVALTLVQGLTLKIEGGDVEYLSDAEREIRGCQRHRHGGMGNV